MKDVTEPEGPEFWLGVGGNEKADGELSEDGRDVGGSVGRARNEFFASEDVAEFASDEFLGPVDLGIGPRGPDRRRAAESSYADREARRQHDGPIAIQVASERDQTFGVLATGLPSEIATAAKEPT